MDFIEILSSINLISIFFFIITLGVLGYEFYLFQKEKKRKEKPTIPVFDPSKKVQSPLHNAVPVEDKVLKKHKNYTVIVAVVIFFVVGVALILTMQGTLTPEEPPPPVSTRATTDVVPTSVGTDSASVTSNESGGEVATQSSTTTSTPTPTEKLLAQATQTPTPTTATSSGIGGAGATSTSTETSTSSSSFAAQATDSPTAVPTTSSLPIAGFSQPQMFILFLGALTVLFSIVF